MTDPSTAAQARAAQTILDDAVFQDAVVRLDERITEDWKRADTVRDRERAHMKQELLRQVVRELQGIVARHLIEQERHGGLEQE